VPFLLKLQKSKMLLMFCPMNHILQNTLAKCKSSRKLLAPVYLQEAIFCFYILLSTINNKVSYKSNSKIHFTAVEMRDDFGFRLHKHKYICTKKKLNKGFPSAAQKFNYFKVI